MMLCKSRIDKLSNQGNKKWKYKANKRAILAKIKQCFVRLFFKTTDVCEALFEIIISVAKESVPIRNNRKYERGASKKVKTKLFRSYVPVV